MGKGIYSYYKERLIEIGGNSKCLYLKSIARKSAYDIGRIFEGRQNKIGEFSRFLWEKERYPLTLIAPSEKKELLENLEVEAKMERRTLSVENLAEDERKKAEQKNDRIRREETTKAVEGEIKKLSELAREIEEIEKETGRYELYIGYPFVFGVIGQGSQKTVIKAPLLLFPVKMEISDEGRVEAFLNEHEHIQLNRALIFAYAQAKKLNIEGLELEFDDLSRFKSVEAIVKYLGEHKIKLECQNSKNIYNYSRFKEPSGKGELSVRFGAVIGRFPLSNSIYNDYSLLEKKKLTTPAIDELLSPREAKRKKKKVAKRPTERRSFVVRDLDYAQSEVVRKVDECGNMVIYGPPGTGKSQTIVNVIANAMCKNQRVLVVSQKKAALDVVFNRLGTLSAKAMYLADEHKEKRQFYERTLEAHQKNMVESLVDVRALEDEYNEIEKKIALELSQLETITRVLNTPTSFGLSLSEMYNASYMLPKSSTEYGVYTKMLENPALMGMKYKELSEALFTIRSKNLLRLYYDFMQDVEKNPVVHYMKDDLDITALTDARASLEETGKSRKGLFNTAKHPYFRQAITYFYEIGNKKKLEQIVEMTCRFARRGLRGPSRDEVKASLLHTMDAIKKHVKDYDFLHTVLTDDGYLAVIDNVLRGNTSYLRLVLDALENYISMRDVNKLLDSLDESPLEILNFAYSISRNYQNYTEILESLLEIRIYHEVLVAEEKHKDELSLMVDFNNITSRISMLKTQQLAVATKLCAGKNSREYETLYESAKDNKDYLYQISKTTNFWPIRQTMEVYGKFVLSLFPCWLLSPENVSSLLPLEKNLFDIVIFDEASQVFIESTIPSIFRGKSIVVAGDAKQLRPSATFMRRYLGADPQEAEDYSVQAALEVESLLDLAVARYDSANITYHYRSRASELIDFSNSAFYGGSLQVAPNATKNKHTRPIERYMVKGKWIDRKNAVEAKKVVDLLREILATRKHGESIGIITFNADQQACINDTIDKEGARDPEFRSAILQERNRKENGEDISLFVKNLENVQGDERDIIIFSIGYAENETGRVYCNFGSLSVEGGENRLNVAVTRAKSRILVVTSIEPEMLKVDTTKHQGPKLLRTYLEYVRAVSRGDEKLVHTILASLENSDNTHKSISALSPIEERMAERLRKLGYTVDLHLGNKNSRISLAIYDETRDKYLVGVELDRDAFESSSSILERDVYKPKFIESRGWTLLRVFSRDWWLSPQKVIKSIVAIAEKNKMKA